MKVLGFMSGTSLDAVDMAIIETDGREILGFGPCGERKMTEATRAAVLRATDDARGWTRGTRRPSSFAVASWAVAQEHIHAAREFLHDNHVRASSLDLIGFHGQTVLHERPSGGELGRTVQLGEAGMLAKGLNLPVAYDFRTADVAAGGQGAPLAPVYHAALVRQAGLTPPLAILNLGGVANITLITNDESALFAFDTGPANGLLDLYVQSRTDLRCDENGRLAARGRVHDMALSVLLNHPYFRETGPKSLDRYDFSLDLVSHLSVEDACATLVAFTAKTVALGVQAYSPKPVRMIASGGGRHNPVLLNAIRIETNLVVDSAEDAGWRGDAVEAEAFAFLAARCKLGLPISYPGTTGVPEPMTGGQILEP
jgi:anhydro-N-acetylmuramic acid kinase